MKQVMVAIALGLAAIGSQAQCAEKGPDIRPQMVQLVADKAQQHNVPLPLALGLIETESDFKPSAYSKGNWGLGQIKCGTARSMGMKGDCRQLLTPSVNLDYSFTYLRIALDVAKNDECVAANLYNGGIGKVLKKASRYCVKIFGPVDNPQKRAIVKHKQKQQQQ
jgi:soluble lytic murein transglycosylase-like protein